MQPSAFAIHIDERQLDDLHRRLDTVRLPPDWPEAGWSFGTDADWLRELLAVWRDGYDWRKRERELNAIPQFTCEIGGARLHFVHIRCAGQSGLPILLTHGWPDSFLRYAKALPLLRGHDLVVPSLPGFAFSTLPRQGFLDNAGIAELWHTLMTEVLGYGEYLASGGDVGRGVTHFLAVRHPQEVRGIHLTDVGLVRDCLVRPEAELTEAELDYRRRATVWTRDEGAYISLQASKPQTLAYALADSPAALAAWMGEKFHAWSDWERLSKEDVLDNLTLHWFCNSAATSVRVYHGNIYTLPPLEKVSAPTAVTIFPFEVLKPPKDCILRSYPVVQLSEADHGGHFTALENPEFFAKELLRFADDCSKGKA